MGGCRGLHLWTVVPQLVHPPTTLSMEMVINNSFLAPVKGIVTSQTERSAVGRNI